MVSNPQLKSKMTPYKTEIKNPNTSKLMMKWKWITFSNVLTAIRYQDKPCDQIKIPRNVIRCSGPFR